MPNIFHSRRAALFAACILLAGIFFGLQALIDREGEHDPFRRVGLWDSRMPLQKTLEWIDMTSRGTDVYYPSPVDASAEAVEQYEQMGYDGCNVALKVTELRSSTLGYQYQVTFNLVDLLEIDRPIKIVYGKRTQWKIPLQSVGSRQVIQDRFGPTHYTSITVPDPAIARRMANAFNHAIRLCRIRMKPPR